MKRQQVENLMAELVRRWKFLQVIVPFVVDLVQAKGACNSSDSWRDERVPWVGRNRWHGRLLNTSAGLSFDLELADNGLTKLVLKVHDGSECLPNNLVLEVHWPRDVGHSDEQIFGNYLYPWRNCETKRFRANSNWQKRLWLLALDPSPLQVEQELEHQKRKGNDFSFLRGQTRRLRIRTSS